MCVPINVVFIFISISISMYSFDCYAIDLCRTHANSNRYPGTHLTFICFQRIASTPILEKKPFSLSLKMASRRLVSSLIRSSIRQSSSKPSIIAWTVSLILQPQSPPHQLRLRLRRRRRFTAKLINFCFLVSYLFAFIDLQLMSSFFSLKIDLVDEVVELVYKVLLKPFMVPDSIMVGLYGLLLLCFFLFVCYIQGS